MKRPLLAALAALSLSTTAILADEETQGEDKSKEAAEVKTEVTPATAESTSTGTVIKGGVKGTALRTDEGLNSIQDSAKMLQTEVLEVAKECTRKETIVVRGPNYIGNGIVIPAVGGDPTGVTKFGDLPARREKLESFISSGEAVFKVLENHMDALILPDPLPTDLANLWSGMRSTLAASKENLEKMRGFLAEEKFDKKAVGRAAMKVYDSMTALEKMRLQIHEALVPEIKNGD